MVNLVLLRKLVECKTKLSNKQLKALLLEVTERHPEGYKYEDEELYYILETRHWDMKLLKKPDKRQIVLFVLHAKEECAEKAFSDLLTLNDYISKQLADIISYKYNEDEGGDHLPQSVRQRAWDQLMGPNNSKDYRSELLVKILDEAPEEFQNKTLEKIIHSQTRFRKNLLFCSLNSLKWGPIIANFLMEKKFENNPTLYELKEIIGAFNVNPYTRGIKIQAADYLMDNKKCSRKLMLFIIKNVNDSRVGEQAYECFKNREEMTAEDYIFVYLTAKLNTRYGGNIPLLELISQDLKDIELSEQFKRFINMPLKSFRIWDDSVSKKENELMDKLTNEITQWMEQMRINYENTGVTPVKPTLLSKELVFFK